MYNKLVFDRIKIVIMLLRAQSEQPELDIWKLSLSYRIDSAYYFYIKTRKIKEEGIRYGVCASIDTIYHIRKELCSLET